MKAARAAIWFRLIYLACGLGAGAAVGSQISALSLTLIIFLAGIVYVWRLSWAILEARWGLLARFAIDFAIVTAGFVVGATVTSDELSFAFALEVIEIAFWLGLASSAVIAAACLRSGGGENGKKS